MDTLEDLCSIQCTQSEIASVLHLHVDTVRDRVLDHYGEEYSIVYKRYSEGGKASLRRIQLNLAKKNPGMAIFLGKQYLGQKDNHEMIQVPPEMLANYNKLIAQIGQKQVELQAMAASA